jgi:hypothetical protein
VEIPTRNVRDEPGAQRNYDVGNLQPC